MISELQKAPGTSGKSTESPKNSTVIPQDHKNEEMASESDDELITVNQIINIKHIKTMTLDKSNYYGWRARFAAILRGNRLMHFMEGNVNLDNAINEQKDQLILGWLLSSISPAILTSVTIYQSSSDVCDALWRIYASDSKSRVLSLRQKLQQLHKGNKSIAEYISEITGIINFLSIAGDQTSENDIVLYTLAGLGGDFEALAQNITTRDSDVNFIQLQSMLTHIEICQQRNASTQIKPVVMTVNVVSTEAKSDKKDLKVIPCQICNRKGHGALNCYH